MNEIRAGRRKNITKHARVNNRSVNSLLNKYEESENDRNGAEI